MVSPHLFVQSRLIATWQELRVMAAIYGLFTARWVAELACQLMAKRERAPSDRNPSIKYAMNYIREKGAWQMDQRGAHITVNTRWLHARRYVAE